METAISVDLKLDQLVDQIAEKLGVVASSIQPIAEETLRQFQIAKLMSIIFCGAIFMLALLTILIWIPILKKDKFNTWFDQHEALVCISGAFSAMYVIIALPISLVHLFDSISAYVAPFPTMLGLL